MIKYKGLITRNCDKAIEYYQEKFGVKPTIILAKPEMLLENEPDIIVVRTKSCIAFGIMLAHDIAPDEYVSNDIIRRERKPGIQSVRAQEEDKPDVIEAKTPVVYKTKPQKKVTDPKKSKDRMCPHCGGRVKDFNALGYWYGWALGIAPPYWEELRKYVFERDNFICTTCHTKTTNPHCHHIAPKEDGGTDSARNLTTLCATCHLDYQPIMVDEPFLLPTETSLLEGTS